MIFEDAKGVDVTNSGNGRPVADWRYAHQQSAHPSAYGQFGQPGHSAGSYPPAYPGTPPQQPKKRRKWPYFAGAAVALFVVIGLVAPDPKHDAAQQAGPTVTQAADTSAANAPKGGAPAEPVALNPAAAAPVVAEAGSATAALTKLDTLAVKGRAPKTGYARTQFGQAWSDDVTVDSGHNGCDTRNDILRRDLTGITVKPGTHGCRVLTGALQDPYTATAIAFQRGVHTSTAVQIDHVVALSDAWQKGAQQLSAEQRRNLANDPRNLQATSGAINESKGSGDAATWLPPNKSYRCTYVSRQIDVKVLYRLWVTQAEKDAMRRVLARCGGGVDRPAPAPTVTTPPSASAQTQAPEDGSPEDVPQQEAPAAPDVPDSGLINGAICNDGSQSNSHHRTGTCSRHGGVRAFL